MCIRDSQPEVEDLDQQPADRQDAAAQPPAAAAHRLRRAVPPHERAPHRGVRAGARPHGCQIDGRPRSRPDDHARAE
eukprot:6794370-Alexandrium_andersonii.AAC.1